MASRFPQKSNNSLFSGYDAQTRAQSNSPSVRPGSTPSHPKKSDDFPSGSSTPGGPAGGGGGAFAAYPGAATSGGGAGAGSGSGSGAFRAATPNSRGQYSDAVLSELESQNEGEIEGLTGKVRMLKDLTTAIGAEIRDSTSLAESMNRSFETTSVKLKGTMNRMLRMAEKTGVGWKVWVLVFIAIWALFVYVWLF